MKMLIPSFGQADGKWLDTDYSGQTGQADIEFTSDCNLRCVYCPVSLPTYHGHMMDPALIDRLRADLPGRNVLHIGINGHGETTIIPGWATICSPFLDMAAESHIISNFSRIFDENELRALARVSLILVSLDTVDMDLLKEIRRKVDLRTIVTNIVAVRATALELGISAPKFQINAGIYDRNVFGLASLVRFCIALKIECVSFWSLVAHSKFGTDSRCDTVESLSPVQLRAALGVIDEAIELLRLNNVECNVPGGFIAEIRHMVDTYDIQMPLGSTTGSL